jgi:hypothetical protein
LQAEIVLVVVLVLDHRPFDYEDDDEDDGICAADDAFARYG